jgi:glycosyltransferase involved in cell wall biosynthesis
VNERLRASVIIPVLNDADHLARTLERLGRDPRVEVIVVDGGGHDEQMAALADRNPYACWLWSSAGRGRQMNLGAAHAHGRWLLFLHADTQLADGWLEELESAARDPTIVGEVSGSGSIHHVNGRVGSSEA